MENECVKILRIIKLIRESHKNSFNIYRNGSCVQLCRILKTIYPNGEILYNEDHAIFEFNNKYYDITGQVEKENHVPLTLDYYSKDALNQRLRLKS